MQQGKISRVDPFMPVNEDEVVLVIRTKESYLRGFAQRRNGLLAVIESIDDVIRGISLGNLSSVPEVRVQSSKDHDIMFRIHEQIQQQMGEKTKEVMKGLHLIDLEEKKFFAIWTTYMQQDPDDIELLNDLCSHQKSIKEVRCSYRGGLLSEQGIYKRRRTAIRRIIKDCGYVPITRSNEKESGEVC